MTYNKSKRMAALNLLPNSAIVPAESANQLADLMADPAYLRHSSALINEALQKGFDVLQLANGDIVTTGTKTVVYTYSWDASHAKLAKIKTPSASRKRKGELIGDDF
jgi:Protein of unknown function (DUF2671)